MNNTNIISYPILRDNPEKQCQSSSLMESFLARFSFLEKDFDVCFQDHSDFLVHTMSRFFLHYLSFIFLLSSLVFLFHSHLNFWIPQISLILALALSTMQLCRNNFSVFHIILANGICIIILIASLLGMGRLYDFSWDGQWYHQADVYLMKVGWNPFYESVFVFIKRNGLFDALGSSWNDLYVKYAETVSANFYIMTGNIQSGKALIVLLAIACFFEAFVLLHNWKMKRMLALLFSLALCLNPIALAQYTTFYVDGILYYPFLLLVLYLLRLENGEESNKCLYLDIVLAALMLSNIKLLGFIYAGLMLGGYWIISLIRKQRQKVIRLVIAGVCLLFLCALTGISPYYKNIKNNHHVFHPFMGNEKIDIMTINTPTVLRPLSPPKRFLYAFLSHTANGGAKELKDILKIPFSVSDQDENMTYDTKQGGFGWFGSGIILLGLFFGCIGLFFSSPQKKAIVIIGTLSLLTVIINPESWWARYVPQLWILPLLGTVLFVGGTNDILKRTRYILCSVLLFFVFLNAHYILSQITEKCLGYTQQVNSVILQMTPSKSHHKIVIRNGLSASLYTLWDHGIVCDPCSTDDIPKILSNGFLALDSRNTYFFNMINITEKNREIINQNGQNLLSPGVLSLTRDNSYVSFRGHFAEDGFKVIGTNSIIHSSKNILVSDNKITTSVKVKNSGNEATKIYVGFAVFTKNKKTLDAQNYPYNEENQILTVVSSEMNSNTITVDSCPKWAKNCMLALNVKEDYSDLPNFNFINGRILDIKQLPDGHAEITMDEPLKERIESGTKIRVHGGKGSGLRYTTSAPLPPNEEVILNASIQKDDNAVRFSPSVFPKGTYYVEPVLLSYSVESDKENTIVISDYTVSY